MTDLLSEVAGDPMHTFLEVCLLGLLREEYWLHHNRVFLWSTLVLAQNTLARMWIAPRVLSMS